MRVLFPQKFDEDQKSGFVRIFHELPYATCVAISLQLTK